MKEAMVSREVESCLCKIDIWTTRRGAKLSYLKNGMIENMTF
jgi:hypothetical protein